MPQMVPNEGTSQLLPSHTSMGRDTVTQNLQHRARRLSLPFPHAIKQSFQRENNKKLNNSLFPTHWQHFFTSLNAAALNGFLFANTYLLLPQNKSFLLQPLARRQQHFFLFRGGKRLQPFDFKHRHPSGLSSRKSVSPRLQIDMFVCRVTLLIRRFSFRHKKCLLVKLQQPIKFQA